MGHRSKAVVVAGLLATSALAAPAWSQSNSPTFRKLDANGVDLVQGDFITSFVEGSIGSGDAALILRRMIGAIGQAGTQGTSSWDRIWFTVTSVDKVVEFGTRMDRFPGAEARGSTLTGSGGAWQYFAPDGTVIAFTNNEPEDYPSDISNQCREPAVEGCSLLPTSITSPDGKTVSLEYGFWVQCWLVTPPGEPSSPDDPTQCVYTPRLKKVSNSYGYSIEFTYASGEGGGGQPPATFHRRTGATFHNAAAGTGALASVSYAYPSSGVTDITDQGGRVWRVTSTSSSTAIRRPGAANNTTIYNLSSGKVTSVVNEGVTTSYSRSVSGNTVTMSVTDALSQVTTIVSSLTTGRPTSITDPLSRTTSFQYDSSVRLTRATRPQGNYVELTYDSRGNVIQGRAVPKSGSGAADIVVSAAYPSTCSNVKTCNSPTSITDPRGNVTDYTYDGTHGGLLTVTAPAPTTGAVRPQVRYSYTRHARRNPRATARPTR